MKILVIGGSGLVGSHILRAATAAGHQIVGTYRKFQLPGLVPLDCADTQAAEALIQREKPDAVVHAAGWTWVDGCEDDPPRALAENAEQPESLARICHSLGAQFTYFSTSYVFDGAHGPYNEDAAPNPISVYAKSKLEGEQRVREASGNGALIPRVICVYGAEAQRKNFAYQVRRAMEEGKVMTLPSDQRGNPTYAGDVARWLLFLLERREKGTWHLAGPWPDCARPEWAEKLVAAFTALGVKRHPGFALKAVPTAELKQRALRPLKAGMVSAKAARAGLDLTPTDFTQSVRELLVEFKV